MLKSILLCLITVAGYSAEWSRVRSETAREAADLCGFCSKEKALLIMDLVKVNKCSTCVEIGVFRGASLLPIARALAHNGAGIVYGVDAWDADVALEGRGEDDPFCPFYRECDFEGMLLRLQIMVQTRRLGPHCKLLRMPARQAALYFLDDSIDFLHVDANLPLQDVVSFYSKIKEGGYILLSDTLNKSNREGLQFFLERAELITSCTPHSTFLLFRKSHERFQKAALLFKNA